MSILLFAVVLKWSEPDLHKCYVMLGAERPPVAPKIQEQKSLAALTLKILYKERPVLCSFSSTVLTHYNFLVRQRTGIKENIAAPTLGMLENNVRCLGLK